MAAACIPKYFMDASAKVERVVLQGREQGSPDGKRMEAGTDQV